MRDVAYERCDQIVFVIKVVLEVLIDMSSRKKETNTVSTK
jgi:hypothetical protein